MKWFVFGFLAATCVLSYVIQKHFVSKDIFKRDTVYNDGKFYFNCNKGNK